MDAGQSGGFSRMRTIWLTAALAALAVMASGAPDSDSFKGTKAYCYFNEKFLTWRIGNDALERTVQFDRDAGALKTMKVTDKKAGRRLAPGTGPEGEFILAPERDGAPPTSVRLDGDWVYMWQSVGTPAHNG